jgi:hypothetical protein
MPSGTVLFFTDGKGSNNVSILVVRKDEERKKSYSPD